MAQKNNLPPKESVPTPKNNTEKPSCVVVFRFSALGDICMAIPVVYAACRANPSTEFVFVTKKPVAPLFINAPENLKVEGVDLHTDFKGVFGPLRLWRYLRRKYPIDAIADLHGVIRTHAVDLCARLRGVKVAFVDKMHARRRDLVSRGAINSQPLTPMHERYAHVFEQLGLSAPDLTEPPMAGIDYPANSTVHPEKRPGEVWIAIAPFAAHKGKIYPEHLMRQVVESLAERPHTRIFLFGGGGHEAEVLSQWENEIPGTLSAGGKKLGFATELAIIGRCDAMLSMDSANMHLASLCGTPVVSIWGATHPYAGFYGWHQRPERAIISDMRCRPCSVFGNKVCRFGTYECLSTVAPQIVANAVIKLVKDGK